MKIIARPPNDEENKRKAVCLEQLAQDRQRLLLRWPFIGGIILRMELIPVCDSRLETACTDGNSIYVNIDFYSSLHKDERLFVLAHEVWHSVLMHFARKGQRDRNLFNQAADLEIHFALQSEKMREPWVLPHNPAWAGLSAEEIYEKLLKKAAVQTKKKIDSSPGKEEKDSFDRHIYSDETLEDPTAGTDEVNSDSEAPEIVIDPDFQPLISADTAERVRGRVVAAAQQVERMQGKLPGAIENLISNILKPVVCWQEVLKQFVTSCYGGSRRWLPPSRRHVWQNLYLPSMRSETLKAVVALDTSGSTDEDLPGFFVELESLMKSFGKYDLTVIQCDADIHKVDHYSSDKPIPGDHQWKSYGGGGTSFTPVFDYLKQQKDRPDLLLYLTDGYGDAPALAPPYPVLWVLVKDGIKPADWGQSVVLKN